MAMTILRAATLLAAVGAFGLGVHAAPTAPLATTPAPAAALVEPAHGCHFSILRDLNVGREGWHYHNRACGRVDTPPPGYFDRPYRKYHKRPICRTECRFIGPIKTCDQVCR